MKNKYRNWWYCDNIISHNGQIAILSLNEPQVFILIRDYDSCYVATFEQFAREIVQVNFIYPEDRAKTSDKQLKNILIDAWNFIALTEKADEDAIARFEAEEDLETGEEW